MLGLGIGIGIPTDKIRFLYGGNLIVSSFKERVITDGGVVESLRCVANNLQIISKPVITLLGDNPSYVDINTTYSDAGATAFDEFLYGDITSLVRVDNNVDTRSANAYKVNYTVIDPSKNAAFASRDVYVLSELAITFRNRIIADSGVIEKIQCAELDYNVNWGYYLGLQNGFNRFLTEYETRISTDSGTLESLNCIRFSDLSNFDWAYNYRVIDDLGVVESLGCINTNK